MRTPLTTLQRRHRRRNVIALALLPLCYLLLLPEASEQGLAAGFLAPAGLERTAQLALAAVLLQVRLVTVLLLPGVAVTLLINELRARFPKRRMLVRADR